MRKKYLFKVYLPHEVLFMAMGLTFTLALIAAWWFGPLEWWYSAIPGIVISPFLIQPWKRIWHGGWEDETGSHWFVDEKTK
jgi:hypothetical protein